MNIVIEKMGEILSNAPDPVLGAGNINAKVPGSGGELPAVVVSLKIESYEANGLGRFVRSGNTLAEHSNIVEVRSDPETFTDNLKVLRIKPLPLKRNPSSTGGRITLNDLQVRNVSNIDNPIEYTFKTHPSLKHEYTVDEKRAEIVFGQSQAEGEALEIVHWTIVWRDDIVSQRYTGAMLLEVWDNDPNNLENISRVLQEKLSVRQSLIRQKGFIKLQPSSLDPTMNILHNPPVGSPFSVWKQQLGYKFTFEIEEGGQISSGIPIKRIDVDLDSPVNEQLTLPS